jgi:selenocysteine-specific elongation factor
VARSHEVDAPARLYVDRVFTLRGIGTVVTGTLWTGSIARGDRLLVEPVGLEVRVRSVQVHDRDVERADAGQRVALNVTGVERARIDRGSAIVAPGAFRRSYRLDVVLEPTAEIPAAVTLHHGTSQVPARVQRGEDLHAQLRLSAPVVAARGDRFVLRTATTVGGGVVLDPAPPRGLNRRKPEPAPAVAAPPPRTFAVDPQAAAEADASLELAGYEAIAVDRAIAEQLEREGRAVRIGDGLAVGRPAYERARTTVVEECGRAGSITLARFRDLLGTSRRPAQLLLERLDADGLTLRVGDSRVLRRSATR